MNDIKKLSNSNCWIMMSSGIASSLDDCLDELIRTGEDNQEVKLINKDNECTTIEVNKQWLIDVLED